MRYLEDITLEIFIHLLFQSESLKLSFPSLKSGGLTDVNSFKESLSKTRLGRLKEDLEYFEFDIKQNGLIKCFDCLVKEKELVIELVDREKLLSFLEKYLNEFKSDTLESFGTYYAFERHFPYVRDLLEYYFKDHKYNIKVNTNDVCSKNPINKPEVSTLINIKGRVLEFLLYLNEKKLLNITSTDLILPSCKPSVFFSTPTIYFNIYVKLLKTPDEIYTYLMKENKKGSFVTVQTASTDLPTVAELRLKYNDFPKKLTDEHIKILYLTKQNYQLKQMPKKLELHYSEQSMKQKSFAIRNILGGNDINEALRNFEKNYHVFEID